MRIVTAWLVNAAALAAAAWLLGSHMNIGSPGDSFASRLITLAVLAAVFTAINQLLTPVIKMLALPFIVITLGLALLVINALMLLLTGWITGVLNVDFTIDGFWWAVLASVIISIVNGALGMLLDRDDDD